MSAAATLRLLADRGFRFEVRGEILHVEPIPDEPTIAELRTQKLMLRSYVAQHGGRWPIPLASEHRYVLWSGALNRERSCCLACGKPPPLHGEGALDDPLIVKEPNSVAVLVATAVVAGRIAETLAQGGRLCSACGKLGRVRLSDGACTFCASDERA